MDALPVVVGLFGALGGAISAALMVWKVQRRVFHLEHDLMDLTDRFSRWRKTQGIVGRWEAETEAKTKLEEREATRTPQQNFDEWRQAQFFRK